MRVQFDISNKPKKGDTYEVVIPTINGPITLRVWVKEGPDDRHMPNPKGREL